MLRASILATTLLLSVVADRVDEDCEACGLLVWRMQTIISEKQKELESLKAAKNKRAAKSTKAHSKRWIKQEYAVALAGAIEAQIDSLPKDARISGSACRYDHEAVRGSALRGESVFHPDRCRARVQKRAGDVLEEFQDELTQAVISGLGAGTACVAAIEGCSAERATLLLGGMYREDMSPQELDYLQPGYSDSWSLHRDVDDSVYWFNKQRMKSVKEPPPGWVKTADGTSWEYKPEAAQAEEAQAEEAPSAGEKDEV